MDDFDDDIFDRNIDQLDVRETPRWELSEEEDEDDLHPANRVIALANQQKSTKNPIPTSTNALANTRPSQPPINPVYPTQQQIGQKFQQPRPSVVPVQPQSPILSKGGPRSSTSTTESVQTVMSPILLPRNLDKKKIEELVKAAYQDDGDSVKDFGAAEREKRPPATAASNTAKPQSQTKEVIATIPPWDDNDADSIKDYTGNDRKKEEQYMVRTDEAIYQRASEEHIKRPPLWHDDEVDSLRDFGRISGKDEVPSGFISQQLSRVPSDEELCLSPLLNEEEDGHERNLPGPSTECKSYTMGKMMAEQRIQQVPPWHEDDNDSTKNYADFWKFGSKENSRRPSDENIYLTPPWMEDDRESSGNQSPSHLTLDDKDLIEVETEPSNLVPASKPEDQNDSTNETQLPGRDSGFCSEQDQHQQTQVLTEGQEFDAAKTTTLPNDMCPIATSAHSTLPNDSTVENKPTTNQITATANQVVPQATNDLARPQDNTETKAVLPQLNSDPRRAAMFLPQVPLMASNLHRPVNHDELIPRPANHEELLNRPVNHEGLLHRPVKHLEVINRPANHDELLNRPVNHEDLLHRPVKHLEVINRPANHDELLNRPVNHEDLLHRPVKHLEVINRPVNHDDLPHRPVKHEEMLHRPVKHDELLHRPVKHDELLHRPVKHDELIPRVPLMANSVVRPVKHDELVHRPVNQLIPSVMPTTSNAICDADSKGIARSISQSSLEANCYSPHDALEGLETSSVVSFASTAATHHDLDTRIDMMQSLISLLGTHDKDDMSRTLLAMSNSKDSCSAMRQSGCLPLLIDLIHGHDNPMARRDCRSRAGLALHNIVYSNPEDRRGRREIRVLRLLEIVRAHCDAVTYSNLPPHPCAERWYPPLRDYGPGPAVAALMKLSFEEDHRDAICELGGCQAVAELVEIDHKVNADCNDLYSVSLRKYAGMTLTNLTFGNTKNKTILCKMEKTIKALISQLKTTKEEELVQVSASVLRNLSWRADDISRDALRRVGAVRALTEAAQKAQSETVLRTLLSGLWNLSAHCPENKTELCNIPGALRFIVRSLNYCSPTGNISVVESSGGILRNLSSHIAVLPECRQVLRDNGCFQSLLLHLRSPSVRVVSNACGALWNLSARCIQDQELLWELGAVSIFKSLVNSKHKAIATASAAALRNLMAVKPSSSHGTDSESVTSRSSKRYRSLPSTSRQVDNQKLTKPTADRLVQRHHSTIAAATTSKNTDMIPPRPHSVSTKPQQLASTKSPEIPRKTDRCQSIKDASNYHGSSSSLDQAKGIAGHNVDPQRKLSGSLRKTNAVDSSSVGSATSDGRHGHLGRWSGSNDSLAQHRRQKNKTTQAKKPAEAIGQHSRSSSDGCGVIQLLTDSYPLQVTTRTNNNQPEQQSIVSPATARRLNQWAQDQAIESIEMSQLYICQQRPAPNSQRVAESRESLGSSSSRHRKKHVQKFRSYRDSESEREADIDSDEEQNVFEVKPGGFANAWLKQNDNRGSKSNKHPATAQSHRPQEAAAIQPQCTCKSKTSIWARRSNKQGPCKKCSQVNSAEPRPVVKSRRDSSDSPLSSPNAVRGFTGDIDDPSKRGVKVTSL